MSVFLLEDEAANKKTPSPNAAAEVDGYRWVCGTDNNLLEQLQHFYGGLEFVCEK